MLLRLLVTLLCGPNLSWDDTTPALDLPASRFEPASGLFSLRLA
jgi:hypothetical protein